MAKKATQEQQDRDDSDHALMRQCLVDAAAIVTFICSASVTRNYK